MKPTNQLCSILCMLLMENCVLATFKLVVTVPYNGKCCGMWFFLCSPSNDLTRIRAWSWMWQDCFGVDSILFPQVTGWFSGCLQCSCCHEFTDTLLIHPTDFLPLQNGATALMGASFVGHEEVVKVLLQERATVDMQTKVLLDWTFHQLFSSWEWCYSLKCFQCL